MSVLLISDFKSHLRQYKNCALPERVNTTDKVSDVASFSVNRAI